MEEQIKAFLASLDCEPAYSSHTRQAYQSDLRCFLAFMENTQGRAPGLKDFTHSHVVRFLETERKAGRQPSTLLRRRASLRCFARFVQQHSPAWQTPFSKEDGSIQTALMNGNPACGETFLNSEQITHLWKVLESSSSPRSRRDQAILALILENGISVSHLVALDLQDLDLETHRLRLVQSNGRVSWIPVETAAMALQRYLQVGRPELNNHPDEQALFISQTGGRLCRQGVWQMLRQWGQRAGLQVPLSPRTARNTAALQLAQSGRSLAEIQLLLGHRSLISTRALLRRLSRAQSESNNQEHTYQDE